MSVCVWDPKFSVGIENIDNQHKRLIEYVNELDEASRTHDLQDIYHVLVHLRDYTVYHFAFEEKLMKEAHYPMLEEHRRIHQAFVGRVRYFKEHYERGEDITDQLMIELRAWLINHIQNTDSGYAHDIQQMLEDREKQEKQEAQPVAAPEKKQHWFFLFWSKLFKK